MAGKVDWVVLRREWEAGSTDVALSKQFRVSTRSIRARRAKEKWVRPGPGAEVPLEPDPGSSSVVTPFRVLQGGRAEASDAPPPEPPEVRERDPKREVSLTARMVAAAEKMLEDLIGDRISPGQNQSRADVFASVMRGAAIAFEKSREAAGVKSGQASVGVADEEEARIDEAVLVVRERNVA